MRCRLAAFILIVIGSTLISSAALAQTYPTKVVRITLPYSSGAGPAVFMRIMADKLSRLWGQQVIVDAKPGASGFIAIDQVKRAAPDGYELLVLANSHVSINPAIYAKLPYDVDTDFVSIGTVYRTPFFVTVATNGPHQSVPALIAAAKANPGKLSYGSPYVGSPSHLGGATVELLTGTTMIHVPYKDQSQIYPSIANGDLSWGFSTIGSALPLIKAGKVKVIAIGTKSRSASQPDVPTIEEAGGPAGIDVDAWMILLAPRGTPPDVVRRVNADLNRMLADPEVLERMKTFGFEPFPGTPEVVERLIKADLKKYADLVKRTGLKAEQ